MLLFSVILLDIRTISLLNKECEVSWLIEPWWTWKAIYNSRFKQKMSTFRTNQQIRKRYL